MDNIDKIVDDIISQLRLHDVMKRKAFISVFVARQNLLPVQERLLTKATEWYKVPFEDIKRFDWFLNEVFGHRVEIWQKEAPYPAPSNHLLLTVGGLTAIIFDYTESE